MVTIVAKCQSGAIKETDDIDRSAGWLGGWDSVLGALGSVVKHLLSKNETGPGLARKFRVEVLSVIHLLLKHSNPTVEYEEQTRDNPFGIAINTIRGQALQVLLQFIEWDGSGIAPDVGEIYRMALYTERTIAVRFLFGYYFFFVMYRDKGLAEELLTEVFTDDPDKTFISRPGKGT